RTTSQGLHRRPWFRHEIYAPGFYTGYGVKTVPGVREAIEQKQWNEANQQIEVVAGVINNYAAEVDRAADIARGRAELAWSMVDAHLQIDLMYVDRSTAADPL